MSRRNRTPLGAGTATAAIASTTLPEGTVPVVPDTVPLASDQISAPQEPASGSAPIAGTVPASVALGGVSGEAVVGIDRAAGTLPEAVAPPIFPTPVPDHVPLDELVPPVDTDVDPVIRPPLVQVPGTVPLPADQLTPVVPVTREAEVASRVGGSTFGEMRERIGAVGEPLFDGPAELHDTTSLTDADTVISAIRGGKVPSDLVAAWRKEIELRERAATLGRRADGTPRRAFPVMYEVEHDGVRHYPGGRLVEVTFDQWERLRRNVAVALDWVEGEDVPA